MGENDIYKKIEKSTEYSMHTRRCFMTGEYCSKQTNVHRDRKKLHENNEINAFVIMNYSNMSDVMYESRMKPFIKSLTKYLFFDEDSKQIICVADPRDEEMKNRNWKKVEKINVLRADSNPVSNYVICNRVCQLMQIADLIVVDVSVESANVFYEFGMAVSFKKFILPICFSESFYEMVLPEQLENVIKKQLYSCENIRKKYKGKDIKNSNNEYPEEPDAKALEKHIDCYPWRRTLFEHFGIRFKQESSSVGYIDFKLATSELYGFSDIQYARFPYEKEVDGLEKSVIDDNNICIGERIYQHFMNNYNEKRIVRNERFYENNTVVIYTMDDFLNETQAGQCIVNFYKNITQYLIDKHCFCGDRIGILGQSNTISDDLKDKKTKKNLQYGVSDIVCIGMNQATYETQQKKIKTNDYPDFDDESEGVKTENRLIKSYISNRCILVCPENPIYVNQLKYGVQRDKSDFFKKLSNRNRFYCLFHVMVDTLKYTNEIVVDLSHNTVQALFWLGVAHGSDIYAITVRHEKIETAKVLSDLTEEEKERHIFDVGGLWTAILRANDTDGFYKQLALTQLGIEQHSKLILRNTYLHEDNMYRQLYAPSPCLKYDSQNTKREVKLKETLREKKKDESLALESYYRDRFWKQMLKSNKLHIFLIANDIEIGDGPRLQIVKWDMDAVKELSYYLSKRKIIGRYLIDALRKGEISSEAQNVNFISIGEHTKPLMSEDEDSSRGNSLIEHIERKIGEKNNNPKYNVLHKMERKEIVLNNTSRCKVVSYRGFCENSSEEMKGDRYIAAQFLNPECIYCLDKYEENSECKKNAESITRLETSSTEENEILEEIIVKWENSGDLFCDIDRLQSDKMYLHFNYDSDMMICAKEFCLELSTDEFIEEKERVQALGYLLNKDLKLKYDEHKATYQLEIDYSIKHVVAMILNERYLELHKNPQGKIIAKFGRVKKTEMSDQKEIIYSMPAQLLLWRERDAAESNIMKYRVALTGVSGPATKALTSILVDEEQKNNIWEVENKIKDKIDLYLPLNDLQTIVRKHFYEILEKRLNKYADLKNIILNYLKTSLYQYFLPFLSISDEQRICNGLKAFLMSIDSEEADIAGIKIDNHRIEGIIECLTSVLKAFCGVEALYQVFVTTESKNIREDRRRIAGIKELQIDSEPVVSCLFTPFEELKVIN